MTCTLVDHVTYISWLMLIKQTHCTFFKCVLCPNQKVSQKSDLWGNGRDHGRRHHSARTTVNLNVQRKPILQKRQNLPSRHQLCKLVKISAVWWGDLWNYITHLMIVFTALSAFSHTQDWRCWRWTFSFKMDSSCNTKSYFNLGWSQRWTSVF